MLRSNTIAVPRIVIDQTRPMIACPTCNCPNRFDYRYCCMCGTQPAPLTVPDPDLPPTRLQSFIATRRTLLESESHSLTKHRLQDAAILRFESFLSQIAQPKTIALATDTDAVDFLISKDLNAITQYHQRDCPHIGSARAGARSVIDCSSCDRPEFCYHSPTSPWYDPDRCPIHAKAESLASEASLLRNGLERYGFGTSWDPRSKSGNAFTSPAVQTYIDFIAKLATSSLVSTVQAVPFTDTACAALLQEWDLRVARLTKSRSSANNLEILRFKAYSTLVCIARLSGRRGGDLIRLHPFMLLWLPDYQGLLGIMYEHKTAIRTKTKARFLIHRLHDSAFCPISRLEAYKKEAHLLGCPISASPYVFWDLPTSPPADVWDQSSTLDLEAVNAAIATTLKSLQLFNGQTLAGFRVGAAIKSILEAPDWEKAVKLGGWRNPLMARRYAQLAEGLHLVDPSIVDDHTRDTWLIHSATFRFFD